MDQGSSLLLDIDGLVVDRVVRDTACPRMVNYTSATYVRAARLALPHPTVVVDRFHLIALGNKVVTDYRRELAWARRGRRGRRCDPEWESGTDRGRRPARGALPRGHPFAARGWAPCPTP